ncbi:MAG: 4-hydroxythreonine-4-phosphate dehydrogenase PdxA [Thermoanaerobaculia bacterium]
MKPLAITLGDPAGIGAEVVLKALAGVPYPAVLFGSRRHAAAAGPIPERVRFIETGDVADSVEPGRISADAGRIALASIDAAVAAIAAGECSALVTAPIHKQAIALAGSPFPGHTELLAERAGRIRYGHDYAMYFDSPTIRTVLLTVHLSLRKAIDAIDAESVAALAQLTSREYFRLYGERPRIAVAGVNPHAGEGGKFGDEELEIARGIAEAAAAGVNITGPHAPDTVFLGARRGSCDVVMAMYHDQGLIAVKTTEFERSVNVTIGLPYLRVSVDHGTAFDIAGKGIADAEPMRYAIEWASRHCGRYA